MEEKSTSARDAARDAENAQIALERATEEWRAAQAKTAKARQLRDYLWDLYDSIDYFNRAVSDLVRAMRKGSDECTDAAHQCLISDGPGGARSQLKDVLEYYNKIIIEFLKIEEAFPEIFSEIKESKNEIENN